MENNIAALEKSLVIRNDDAKGLLMSDTCVASIKSAIETAKKLVFQPTDDGDKEVKKVAASMNKYSKAITTQVNVEIKLETKELDDRKAIIINLLKEFSAVRDDIINQSAERIQEKLDNIRELLILELAYAWNDAGVENEFQSDTSTVEKAVKLPSLTPKGVLVKKAKDYIKAICDKNLSKQGLRDKRLMMIENMCMKAGIDASAITREYIGEALFFGPDDEFESRVNVLLTIEVEKKDKAEKKIEADRQKAVSDALEAQQAEVDNKAREKASAVALECAEQSKIPSTQKQHNNVSSTSKPLPEKENHYAAGHSAKPAIIRPKEFEADPRGKRTVQVTIIIEKEVPNTVSDDAVESFVMGLLPEKLTYSLKEIIVEPVKEAA